MPAIKERGNRMNLKYLDEKRVENQEQMQKILNMAKSEKRALSEEEITKFNELKKLINEIDATIKAEEDSRKIDIEDKKEVSEETKTSGNKEVQSEERAFTEYIVNGKERADSPGMSYGSNGAIVPTTIAKKIIEKVKELSPIYEKVEKFHTKGTLEIPVYDADLSADSSAGSVNVAYQGDEFTSLVAGQGNFTSVELKSYSHGALSVVSRKLLNNTDINVTSFLTNKIAQAFADFWERELLIGTGSANNHMTGAIATTNLLATGNTTYTAANAAKIDNLISLQLAVPQQYQKNAIGIVGWAECDSKIQNNQMIAGLKMAASA